MLVGLLGACPRRAAAAVSRSAGSSLTAGFVAQVLAMSLLGPGPAVAIAPGRRDVHLGAQTPIAAQWLDNLSSFAVFPLVGGLIVQALDRRRARPPQQLAHERHVRA